MEWKSAVFRPDSEKKNSSELVIFACTPAWAPQRPRCMCGIGARFPGAEILPGKCLSLQPPLDLWDLVLLPFFPMDREVLCYQ